MFAVAVFLFLTVFVQMAPEVGMGQPYNELCDVYSFGVLVWEMMALRKPYGTTDMAGMIRDVWNDGPEGKRPSPSLVKTGQFLNVRGWNSLWQRCHGKHQDTKMAGSPVALQTLVVSCWSAALDDRPSMSTIEHQLWEERTCFGHDNHDLEARRHWSIGSTVSFQEDKVDEEDWQGLDRYTHNPSRSVSLRKID
jgi:serine/threonine protein kinase